MGQNLHSLIPFFEVIITFQMWFPRVEVRHTEDEISRCVRKALNSHQWRDFHLGKPVEHKIVFAPAQNEPAGAFGPDVVLESGYHRYGVMAILPTLPVSMNVAYGNFAVHALKFLMKNMPRECEQALAIIRFEASFGQESHHSVPK